MKGGEGGGGGGGEGRGRERTQSSMNYNLRLYFIGSVCHRQNPHSGFLDLQFQVINNI